MMIDSATVGAVLSKASGLSVTALNSSISSFGGAQLDSFALTTPAVDNSSLLLSGESHSFHMQCWLLGFDVGS